jgi:hypothetical protein
LGKIAKNGSSQEKKAIALKGLGSNLFLESKKARGFCMKPWSFLCSPEFLVEVVGERRHARIDARTCPG